MEKLSYVGDKDKAFQSFCSVKHKQWDHVSKWYDTGVMICISTNDQYIYFDIGNSAIYFTKLDIKIVLEEMRKYT